MNTVAELLVDWRRGDAQALDKLVPLVYDELRRLARAQLRREAPGTALQATALVHELYLRLVNVREIPADGRAHFLGIAGRVMRQILVDHARRRQSAKRGAGAVQVGLEEAALACQPAGVDILALDQALNELAALDPRQRDLVEMKFFAGLTIDESAAALGVSVATVEREWALAKAWLHRRLS